MDNTGQPIMSVTFNCQEYFEVEKKFFQYGSSRFVSSFELVRDFLCTSNHMCFCEKFIKFILKRCYASNHISI